MELLGPNGKPIAKPPALKPYQKEVIRHAEFHSVDVQKSFGKRCAAAKVPGDDFAAASYKVDKMLTSLFATACNLAVKYISAHQAVEERCVQLVRDEFRAMRERIADTKKQLDDARKRQAQEEDDEEG